MERICVVCRQSFDYEPKPGRPPVTCFPDCQRARKTVKTEESRTRHAAQDCPLDKHGTATGYTFYKCDCSLCTRWADVPAEQTRGTPSAAARPGRRAATRTVAVTAIPVFTAAMKKHLVIGAAVLAAAALLAAPDAHAVPTPDTAGFLAHVHALGFPPSGDASSLDLGMRACTAITAGGATEPQLQAEAERAMAPKGYTAAQADQFVLYAVVDLCPDVATR